MRENNERKIIRKRVKWKHGGSGKQGKHRKRLRAGGKDRANMKMAKIKTENIR